MSNPIYVAIHYVMWVGLALCCILLLPFPRCLRRPLVTGLEKVLTNKIMKHVQCYFLLSITVVFANSLYQMKQHKILLLQQKGMKLASVMGQSLMELEKTINQTRMHLFLDQRNAQMTFFVLVLFFVVFTYLYSLKRDDDLHSKLLSLQEKKPQVQEKKPQDEKAKQVDQTPTQQVVQNQQQPNNKPSEINKADANKAQNDKLKKE